MDADIKGETKLVLFVWEERYVGGSCPRTEVRESNPYL